MSEELTTDTIDAADPRSLASLLPLEMAELVRTLPNELLIQDEVTLTTFIQPTPQQKRVKIQFWDEYEAAIRQNRKMILAEIVFGVCTREYFLDFINNARRTAWLISPRPRYQVRVAELIEAGLDQIEEIFKIKIVEGKNDITVRTLQLSALRMLDMRKHGGYTQRVEQRSLQLSKSLDGNPGESPDLAGKTMEELQLELEQLTKKVEQGKNQNGALLSHAHSDVIIDITPRKVDGETESIAVTAIQGTHRD